MNDNDKSSKGLFVNRDSQSFPLWFFKVFGKISNMLVKSTSYKLNHRQSRYFLFNFTVTILEDTKKFPENYMVPFYFIVQHFFFEDLLNTVIFEFRDILKLTIT